MRLRPGVELPAGENCDWAAGHCQVGSDRLAKHGHGGAGSGATCREETGSTISMMQIAELKATVVKKTPKNKQKKPNSVFTCVEDSKLKRVIF